MLDQSPRRRGRPTNAEVAQRTAQRIPQRALNWRARRTIEEIEETGRFYIDPALIPDGMSYEWKAVTCMGEELREHQVRLARDGAWDAVPANRHPEIMGKYLDKDKPDQAIIIGGQMLMERPLVYTQEAEAEQLQKANAAMGDQFRSLGLNDNNSPFPKMKPQIKRDYSVQAVPDDDTAEASA